MAQAPEDQEQKTDDPDGTAQPQSPQWTAVDIHELYNILPFNCTVVDIRNPEAFNKSKIWKSKNIYISSELIQETHSDHTEIVEKLKRIFGGASFLSQIGGKVRKRFVIVSDTSTPSIYDFIYSIFLEIKSTMEKAANYTFNVLSPQSFTDFNTKYPFYCSDKMDKMRQCIYPSCILQNKLFLGTGQQANTDDVIINLGLTHIVNVSKEIPCKYIAQNYDGNMEEKEENEVNAQSIGPLEYLYIEIDDKESAASELAKHFESAADFIQNALTQDENPENTQNRNRVLVHCEMGVSRSSSLVLAYLMKCEGMTLCEAYAHTKKCRDVIRPNEGFYGQLVEYEKTLKGKSTEEELKALGFRDIEVDQKAANLKMVLGQAIAINQGQIKTKKKKKKKVVQGAV